jgi:hypothetical protein
MTNLLKKIISGSPREEYDRLNKELESFDKYLEPITAERLARESELAKARGVFMSSPSRETLTKWELARQRALGTKTTDYRVENFSHLQTIAGDVESSVSTQREALKTSPKAMRIYMACLREITASVRKVVASKREEIAEKLRGVGASVDIDQVAPLPLWTGRADHLHNLAAQLEVKIASPAVLMRQGLVDECRAAIESDPLNAPAPTPFIPRQQQAWPAGTSFAQAGVEPDAPPVAPAPVNAVPEAVTQAIKARLVEAQNRHFLAQERQVAEELARQAAAAKQQQAVAA